MRAYIDTSALVKRVVVEPESAALVAALDSTMDLIASSLAWVEVNRALRRSPGVEPRQAAELADRAMTGVDESPLSDAVLHLARRIEPAGLRSLDAIHLATVVLLDVDVVFTYDGRLAAACRHHGLLADAPTA